MTTKTSDEGFGAMVVPRVDRLYFKASSLANLVSLHHYLHLLGKTGKAKSRVFRDGQWWKARTMAEQHTETCLYEHQIGTALTLLTNSDCIECRTFLIDKSVLCAFEFLR
jgi:hypothetical protein